MRGGAGTAPSERTEDGPSRITEFLHGRRDTTADDVPAFRRVHQELFVPVDDRAGLQKDGRHPSGRPKDSTNFRWSQSPMGRLETGHVRFGYRRRELYSSG